MTPSLPPALGDLSPDEFRRAAHHAVDWITDYLETNEKLPVVPHLAPGAVARQLPHHAPEHAEPLDELLRDFEQLIVPGSTHWNHPGFLAYFAISASMPGILGEMLAAALDNNAMLWKTGPSETELELRVLEWLRDASGMSGEWFGIINDTASISTMLSLAAAREARPGLDIRRRGMAGRVDLPPLRVYASAHAHSSVDKAVIALGIGQDNLVHVPADDEFRMDVAALERAVADDRAHGRLPLAVVATLGTTSSASVDPVAAIADVCEREQVWLHIDASYAGVTALLPEMRHHFAGVNRADSYVVNPHKWLFTPVDCSAMYTRHPEVLKRTFSLVPEYLTTPGTEAAVNLMDYGIQLGRRFRSLKLWFVLRAFGLDGIRQRLRHHIAIAQAFAQRVRNTQGWELSAPTLFSLVCIRYAPPGLAEAEVDELNQRILDRVNATGEVFLSHTRLRDRLVLRLAIGNIRTDTRHLDRAWELLEAAAQRER